MTIRARDLHYMTLALRLAAKGRGTTSPNPMVGAIVVKDGRIVGHGYHLRSGDPHAEILALRMAGANARGATLYVTLEPCCHLRKRTPPCVPNVLQAGVRRVVVAMRDPNPLVAGKGVASLRRKGVSVTVGVAAPEAEVLNQKYRHWIRTKRPYVTLKSGMTLDGRIATESGMSRWITSKQSRQEAHQLRADTDAILVGVGTVVADNPSLTARISAQSNRLMSRQPLRIVVDSRLRAPIHSRIFARQEQAKTLVATTKAAPESRVQRLRKKGIEVLRLPEASGRVSLRSLIDELGRRGTTSLLVEGGSEINAAMLKARLIQHVRLYVALALMGGRDAKGVIGGKSPIRPTDMYKLKRVQTRFVGNDLVVEGDL